MRASPFSLHSIQLKRLSCRRSLEFDFSEPLNRDLSVLLLKWKKRKVESYRHSIYEPVAATKRIKFQERERASEMERVCMREPEESNQRDQNNKQKPT